MASPTVPKFPFMILEGKRWSARLDVPRDVREQLGKRVLKFSTGLTDPYQAYRKAEPVIKGWRRDIAAARGQRDGTVASAILQARRQFSEAQKGDGPDEWETIIHPLLVELGHLPPDSEYVGDAEARERGIDEARHSPKAIAIIEQVTGERTPFAIAKATWETSLAPRPARQQDQYKSDFRKFVEFVGGGCTLEAPDMLAKKAQEWAEALMAGGLSHKTAARKLSVLQSYWRHLVARKTVPSHMESPFRGRDLPSSKRQDPTTKRQPFKVEDVVNLYWAALENKDQSLADLILIGAYTGARIEEIAGLEVQEVDMTANTVLMSSKTDAGHRVVPVLPEIEPVMKRLIEKAQAGQWLFHVSGKNKYEERSAAIGKRFGKLKTAQGFDGRFVFHSIRKTVATLFENAHIPEGVAADIVGHEKPTMTYGLYSGGTSLAVKREAMVKALKYPGLP